MIAAGGPSHWSFGGGMLWLTGHWEWHALCCYVLVPLDGEPTMIYSMGGTHAEAVRRQVEVAVKDVRHSRNGQYAEVMVERLKELKLERGRIGLMEIDPRHDDYMPVNQYNTLRDGLPDAELVFTKGFLHDLVVIHSAEELDCVRKAGVLCQRAMEAMVARAKPGVKEYELRAAAGAAILEGGGDIDFLIIGSTPMANPAMIFGNPRPSGRVLQKGDIINMELAAGYRGYTAQIGSPICLGEPTDMVRKFWEDITLPGYKKIVAEIAPGKTGRSHAHGEQVLPRQRRAVAPDPVPRHRSRHRQAACRRRARRGVEVDMVLKPGMVIMAEPNPITADGMFGIFLGHTFIVNDKGPRGRRQVSAGDRGRAAEYAMKFGTATFNETQHQYIKFYKEALEKASGGRIEVGIYPRSELGPIPRMIDGLQLGTIEAYIGPADFYVGVEPRFGVFSTPMLFKNGDHASATVMDPALNSYILGSRRAKGIVGIGTFGLGASNYAAKSRSCGSPISPARSCASTPPRWSARR